MRSMETSFGFYYSPFETSIKKEKNLSKSNSYFFLTRPRRRRRNFWSLSARWYHISLFTFTKTFLKEDR